MRDADASTFYHDSVIMAVARYEWVVETRICLGTVSEIEVPLCGSTDKQVSCKLSGIGRGGI